MRLPKCDEPHTNPESDLPNQPYHDPLLPPPPKLPPPPEKPPPPPPPQLPPLPPMKNPPPDDQPPLRPPPFLFENIEITPRTMKISSQIGNPPPLLLPLRLTTPSDLYSPFVAEITALVAAMIPPS